MAVSALLAMLVSLVPQVTDIEKQGEMPVFGTGSFRKLTKDSLVDFMLAHPVSLQLKRIDVRGTVLFAEWRRPEGVSERDMVGEMVNWLRACLIEADNVEEVRVFLRTGQDGGWWIRAERKDLKRDPGMRNLRRLPSEEYLRSLFHVEPAPPRLQSGGEKVGNVPTRQNYGILFAAEDGGRVGG
jgi:hypothetical protein